MKLENVLEEYLVDIRNMYSNMTDEERTNSDNELLAKMGQEKIELFTSCFTEWEEKHNVLATHYKKFIEIFRDPNPKTRLKAFKEALEQAKTDPILNDTKTSDDRFFALFENILNDLSATKILEPSRNPVAEINTTYPGEYITPVDKISGLAFLGKLNKKELQEIAMERRGAKKEITTVVSIDFNNLTEGNIKIHSKKELTPYDREVHDAIVTLFVVGENDYITPQMIYQVMTGNPKARLEQNQALLISDCITKFMYSRVIIKAEDEAQAYGFDKFEYDGNLINGERVTATLNGNVIECLHILRMPVLYEYANKKNQIGRFDIKLLNSPINKNEESIILQGYLYRRILAMKGSNLSKNILYSTVYTELAIQAVSDNALRMKKSSLRKKIKDILDYWKAQGFIKDHTENTKGTEKYSVTIHLKK